MADSIADQAVAAIAAVARMDAETTNEHAERHQIRTLKRIAEASLLDAFRRAQELAYAAEDLRRLHNEVRAATTGTGEDAK